MQHDYATLCHGPLGSRQTNYAAPRVRPTVGLLFLPTISNFTSSQKLSRQSLLALGLDAHLGLEQIVFTEREAVHVERDGVVYPDGWELVLPRCSAGDWDLVHLDGAEVRFGDHHHVVDADGVAVDIVHREAGPRAIGVDPEVRPREGLVSDGHHDGHPGGLAAIDPFRELADWGVLVASGCTVARRHACEFRDVPGKLLGLDPAFGLDLGRDGCQPRLQRRE
mmetsp:Transcript_28821/g.86518  ORF Transcript_28821/g.86518 Transcript_28821/m.86518 type:complete len:223 (+) Transcript_28821:77-745(+)